MITSAAQLSSRFTPMPTGLHLGFCVFATIIFLIIFLRRKTVSSLIWMLICDTTAILQFYYDPKTALAVGICELIMFVVLFFVSAREKKEQKKRAAELESKKALEAVEAEKADSDDLLDIEKLIKSERSKLVDDSTTDIIGNAFEDDKP